MLEAENFSTLQCFCVYGYILNNDSLGNDVVLVLFLVAVMKCTNKSNLREKKVYLATVLG